MKRCLIFLLLVLPALLIAPQLAVPDPPADELKANQTSLDEYRKSPAELSRLRYDAIAFLALQKEQRDPLFKLHYDLHREPAASQTRLKNVLERYARWLGRLPEKHRDAVKNESDITARLVVIRELRDHDWMQTRPRVVREQWQALAGPEKAVMLGRLRQEERQRHRHWRLAVRFWQDLIDGKSLPTRLADLSARDQEGVGVYLMPLLSKQDRLRLKQADGIWPDYPTTLVELADAHPFALRTPSGPTHFAELPPALKDLFNTPIQGAFALGKKPAELLKNLEGQWPDFAQAVASVNKMYPTNNRLPRELWAYDFASLQQPMQVYVTKLMASLPDRERLQLQGAEGKWPDYPVTIQKLARAHKLPPPPWETALTGSPERWDEYRAVSVSRSRGKDSEISPPGHELRR
jgi:hypothetical protein